MNTTNRARIHGWLIGTSLAAVAIADAAAANQAAGPLATTRAAAPVTPTAQYQANASVLMTHGATQVVFDQLFRNNFGHYALVPARMERALLDGTALRRPRHGEQRAPELRGHELFTVPGEVRDIR